jgi:hypothetical protein
MRRLAVAFVLWLGFAAAADAQLIPTVVPAFDPPARSTFSARSNTLFEAGQIVDRPTSDLRPRFYWGLSGSVAPSWSIPGNTGTWFFEGVTSANPPKMNGRDVRVGFVRARQVGFEMGASLVRRTVSSFTIIRDQSTVLGNGPAAHLYSAGQRTNDGRSILHLVIPIARIGERAQLGFLAGGGIAWIPDVPIQKRIDGPRSTPTTQWAFR